MTYLRNCWYAAAYAHEVDDAPLARQLLDEPIVFFRTPDGRAHALFDRCPHRFAPLSMGKLVFDYWARNYWQGQLEELVTRSDFRVQERSFVWLTFEGISGHQPSLIRASKSWLRRMSNTMERLPLIRRFGVSQVLVCQK